MTAALQRSLRSLSIPNYRRYFSGQIVSIAGTWAQTVAEMWLVVQLTGEGAAVGIAFALQFLPMLLFGAYGGVIVDRHDRRKLLMMTQAAMAVPALAMLALSASGHVTVWWIYALILMRGCVLAIDNPARQSFVMELVGPGNVVNAVSLNAVIVHTSRITGPAIAGILIATVGVTPCFAVNAASFAAMLFALRTLNLGELRAAPIATRGRGQVRAAIREVRRLPELRIPMVMMAVIGALAYNFQVVLPLFARFTWHGSATTYSLLLCTMAAGAVIGALVAGSRTSVTPRLVVGAATLFGASALAAAVAPTLGLQLLALPSLGAAGAIFGAAVNSSLQLLSAGELRGRVMALYSVVFLGSTPVGAPLIGWLSGAAGPRWGLVAGSAACFGAAIWARWAYARAGISLAAPAPLRVTAVASLRGRHLPLPLPLRRRRADRAHPRRGSAARVRERAGRGDAR